MIANCFKRSVLTAVFVYFSLKANSQVRGVVIDKATKAPVAYCTIWVAGKQAGTTAEQTGQFSLLNARSTDSLHFSAMGYEPRRVRVADLPDTLYLQPAPLVLTEVVVTGRRNTRRLKVGTYAKRKINYYLGSGGYPRMMARYFPYDTAYERHPYLKEIRVLTASEVVGARFHIRLYRVGADGSPGELLYDQSLLGIAPKGKSATKVDVSDLSIRFPEEGLFVAIEWLIIDRNKHVYETKGKHPATLVEGRVGHTRSSYQPMVGTAPGGRGETSWMRTNGSWHRVASNQSPATQHSGQNKCLALELILSN